MTVDSTERAIEMETSNAEKIIQRDQILAEYRQICADIEGAERLGFDTSVARAVAKRIRAQFDIDVDQQVSGEWVVSTFGCTHDVLGRLNEDGRRSETYRVGDVIAYNPRPSGPRRRAEESSEEAASAEAPGENVQESGVWTGRASAQAVEFDEDTDACIAAAIETALRDAA